MSIEVRQCPADQDHVQRPGLHRGRRQSHHLTQPPVSGSRGENDLLWFQLQKFWHPRMPQLNSLHVSGVIKSELQSVLGVDSQNSTRVLPGQISDKTAVKMKIEVLAARNARLGLSLKDRLVAYLPGL